MEVIFNAEGSMNAEGVLEAARLTLVDAFEGCDNALIRAFRLGTTNGVSEVEFWVHARLFAFFSDNFAWIQAHIGLLAWKLTVRKMSFQFWDREFLQRLLPFAGSQRWMILIRGYLPPAPKKYLRLERHLVSHLGHLTDSRG
jgi:hypothetical protein